MLGRSLTLALALLGLPLWLGAMPPQLQSIPEARRDAERIIYTLIRAIESLDSSFQESYPQNLEDPNWVLAKLENMASIDQLIRRVLVEEFMTRPWPNEVRKAYLTYFYNMENPDDPSGELGYAQQQDLYNYQYLKYLINESPALSPYGWPVRSRYGRNGEYYAFLICQHAQPFDSGWQRQELLPHIARLVESGESAPVVYAWLSNPAPSFMRDLDPLLEDGGGLWTDMIPEVRRLERFFQAMPEVLEAADIPPLVPRQ